MGIIKSIVMRMFGLPRGGPEELSGDDRARLDAECGVRACDLLEIAADDSVLEVGFGPGVTIEHVSKLVPAGRVFGVEPSLDMVAQARIRNAEAIGRGHVDLRHGSVERLPFDDDTFDGALSINALQAWTRPVAGLREIRRVMRPGATIVLGFTPYAGQPQKTVTETLLDAGFEEIQVVEIEAGFCALATKL
jgi:ubiquinone/menaquinone biosynthesis C-methylase UbiE